MARPLLDKDTDLTSLYDDVQTLANMYCSELDRTDSVASGKLRSFDWNIDFDGSELNVYFLLPDYWRFIEFGRGATTQSQGGILYQKILEWIAVKNIVPRHGTRDSLARAITRKIHQEGYFRPPLPKGRHPLANTLRAATSNGLIGKMLKDVVSPMMGTINVSLADLAKR